MAGLDKRRIFGFSVSVDARHALKELRIDTALVVSSAPGR